MLKTRMTRFFAVFMAAILLATAMPAEGTKVMAAAAKKLISCILEPTLVYNSVYGFKFGVSPAWTETSCVLIDMNGKEIIPEGKYEHMTQCFNSPVLAARDKQNNCFLIDTAGNVKFSYGVADYVNFRKVNGVDCAAVTKRSTSTVTYYNINTNAVIKTENYGSGGSDKNDLEAEILNYGPYEDVMAVGRSTFIAKVEGEPQYDLYDSKLNMIASFNDVSLVKTRGVYLVFEGIDETTKKAAYTVVRGTDGKILVDKSTKYDDFEVANMDKETDAYFVAITANDVYDVYNYEGKLVKSVTGFTGIDVMSYTDYVVLKKEANSEANTTASILNVRTGAIVDLGVVGYYSYTDFIQFGVDSPQYLSFNAYSETGSSQKVYNCATGKLHVDMTPYFKESENAHMISDNLIQVTTFVEDGKGDYYYSKAKIYDVSGKVFKDFGECSYFQYYPKFSTYFVVDRNGATRTYSMSDDSLILETPAEWETTGVEIDGIIPARVNGKWGIYKIYDNPVYATPAPQPATPSVNAAVKPYAKALPKISKVVAGKKKVEVKLPKLPKGEKGYVIQYSLKSSFKKASTVYTTSSKAKIKKLKSKKKYFIRYKTYKLNGKKKVLSKKWSASKKVTVK